MLPGQREALGWGIMGSAGVNVLVNLAALGSGTALEALAGCGRCRREAKRRADRRERLFAPGYMRPLGADQAELQEEFEAREWCAGWEPHREWCLLHGLDISAWAEEIQYQAYDKQYRLTARRAVAKRVLASGIAAADLAGDWAAERARRAAEEQERQAKAELEAAQAAEEERKKQALARKQIEDEARKKHARAEAKLRNGGVSPESESSSSSSSSSSSPSERELGGKAGEQPTLGEQMERELKSKLGEVDRRYKQERKEAKARARRLAERVVSKEPVNGEYLVYARRGDYGDEYPDEEEKEEEELPPKKKPSALRAKLGGKFSRDLGGARAKLERAKKNTTVSIREQAALEDCDSDALDDVNLDVLSEEARAKVLEDLEEAQAEALQRKAEAAAEAQQELRRAGAWLRGHPRFMGASEQEIQDSPDLLFNDHAFNHLFQEASRDGPTMISRHTVIQHPKAIDCLIQVDKEDEEVQATALEMLEQARKPKKEALLEMLDVNESKMVLKNGGAQNQMSAVMILMMEAKSFKHFLLTATVPRSCVVSRVIKSVC